MHGHPRTPELTGEQTQLAILRVILDDHPATLSGAEIHTRLHPEDASFRATDRTRTGLWGLLSHQLIRRSSDDRYAAQPATVHMAHLYANGD